MKKYLDKLKKKIKINKNLFIFLLTIVIIGITAGAIFMCILNTDDKLLVTNYIQTFFNNVVNNKLNYSNSLINSLILSLGLAFFIWILGISVIGLILVIIILFLKSFVLGFSITSIISVYKLKGILMAFLYAFPHLIINILVFILISAFALIMSVKIINIATSKTKQQFNFKQYMNRYLFVLIFTLFILLLTSFYEVYVVPSILSFILDIVKL